MSRPATRLATGLSIGLVALLVALPAFAGKVYQWKDAQGVTHYSDEPPPEDPNAKGREFKDGPAATQATAATNEHAECAQARANLERLKGVGPVGLDENGDGKPDKEMTAEERTRQVEKTEYTLKKWCTPPASGA